MEIKGEWQFCEDGIVRPVVLDLIQNSNGEWISARLLIDTGANRTVLSASALSELGFVTRESEEGISGLG